LIDAMIVLLDYILGASIVSGVSVSLLASIYVLIHEEVRLFFNLGTIIIAYCAIPLMIFCASIFIYVVIFFHDLFTSGVQ